MIITVKILEVLARYNSFIRGPALWCRGELDEEQEIGVIVYSRDFPVGLINNFIVGEDLSCYLRTAKGTPKAEVLPLDNQHPAVLGLLIGSLMKMANEAGQEELNDLPDATPKQINGSLPPSPQPEAEELDHLFELSMDQPDSIQQEEEPQ